MPKLYTIVDEGVRVGYYFDCLGCGLGHSLVASPSESGLRLSWEFNGDIKNPTFYPSLLSKFGRNDGSGVEICHLYVTDGCLHFLDDCTHELAGKTVTMEEIAEEVLKCPRCVPAVESS